MDESEEVMSEERLEIVNKNGETIGTRLRSEIHGKPLLMHKVVHVLVLNSRGDILLQKRSMNKSVAPGKWDTSVGGHVSSGESLEEAVQREMEEELGIRKADLSFLYSYIHTNPHETELVYTYSTAYDGKIDFQKDEIDEVRPWSIKEIKASIGSGLLSENFEHEIQMYLNYMTKTED